jgi:hypothetical protein
VGLIDNLHVSHAVSYHGCVFCGQPHNFLSLVWDSTKNGNFNGSATGASAPEILVQRVVDRVSTLTGADAGQLAGAEEGVSFPLPKWMV